jgi:hypothetical protein
MLGDLWQGQVHRNYCGIFVQCIRWIFKNRLVRLLPQLHNRMPCELLAGNAPDISEFLEYEWYQPVWYYDSVAFPQQHKLMARWIGVAHRI